MKLKKISADRLAQIAQASCGSIQFKTVDGNVTSIMFQGPYGPVFVEVGSYTVTVNELATKKVFKPNLQKVRAVENGSVRNVKVCTRCIRSGAVKKAC